MCFNVLVYKLGEDGNIGLIITLIAHAIAILAATFCRYYTVRRNSRKHIDISFEQLVEKLVELDTERDIKAQIAVITINQKREVPSSTVEIKVFLGSGNF